MRVFRSTYKDKGGRTVKTRTWYVEFRDHLEMPRRVSGFTDRKATAALGRNIEKLAWCKAGGQALAVMRDSDINLTMSRYTHVFRGQEADAVGALPDLDAAPVKQSAKATGTDHATAQAAQAAQGAPGRPRTNDHAAARPTPAPGQ